MRCCTFTHFLLWKVEISLKSAVCQKNSKIEEWTKTPTQCSRLFTLVLLAQGLTSESSSSSSQLLIMCTEQKKKSCFILTHSCTHVHIALDNMHVRWVINWNTWRESKADCLLHMCCTSENISLIRVLSLLFAFCFPESWTLLPPSHQTLQLPVYSFTRMLCFYCATRFLISNILGQRYLIKVQQGPPKYYFL